MFTLNATTRPSECVIGRHYRHTETPLSKVHYIILIEHLLNYLGAYIFSLVQNRILDLSPIQTNSRKIG
jgi:hypothetical protein